MLKKIKSTFFVKNLFRHIDDEITFRLVKFNKTLQKLININLNNYRLFSGRYIIYDKDGKGKEYCSYNNNVIFEGEYLNGKRNGKGKEYNNRDELIFEGEYLKGKRWNGFYYSPNGNKYLINNGEYLGDNPPQELIKNNNNIHRYAIDGNKVREINHNRKILYEGEYLYNKRNGKGNEYNIIANFRILLKD